MTAPKKNFTDRIWDFFCSLKLTIILLLLLAITSIIGTVIQQNAPAADYIREYGRANYELFVKLQFTDMYHSTWFIGILALFSINLICCSIKNFPRVWKFVKEPQTTPGDGTFKNSANRADFQVRMSREQAVEALNPILKKEFSSPIRTEKDGKLYLFAQKGIYSRFGAYVTHLSILIIMGGAIVGNLWGYKAYVNIPEGSEVSAVQSRSGAGMIPLGFTVRCEDFHVSFYQNSNRPKDYTSDLVVIENGQEVLKKTIEVNDPLTYKGITFYQSSYGPAGNAFFKVRATDNASGETVEVEARQGEQVELPNGYSFTVTNFTQNDRNFGPAMQLRVQAPDGQPGTPFVVWQNFPQFDVKRGGLFSFALQGFEQPQFTGLQVAKDPGVNIVWIGCTLMVFGSLSAFFFSHKRIWIRIEEDGKQAQVQVAANAHRNQPGFSLAFEELEKKLAAALNTSSQQKEG